MSNSSKYKKLMLTTLLLFIVSVIGFSYAWFSYSRVGSESKVIAGSLYLVMNEGNDTITLETVFPETKEEARAKNDNTVTFTVSGKNTSTDKPIVYEILLEEGTEKSGKERFDAKDLVFDLVEVGDNNEETYVLDAVSYEEFSNTRIWVDRVEANTSQEIEKTYKLRMWLSEDVLISDTDPNANYKATGEDAFKNHYASIKVAVQGDLVEKVLPLTVESNEVSGNSGINNITHTIENEENAQNTYQLNIVSSNSNIKFIYNEEDNTISNISSEEETPKVSFLIQNENNYTIKKLADEEIAYDSFEKTYQLSGNKKVSFDLEIISTSGKTEATDLSYTLRKNGEVVQELVKHVKVLGRLYTVEFADKEVLYTGKPITLDNPVIKDPDGKVYTGEYTITYHNGNSCTGEALQGAPTDVGVYSQKIVVPATANVEETTVCRIITITKSSSTITVINAGGEYSGSEVPITISPAQGVVVKYYTDNTCTTLIDANNETKVPVNAGVYYAKAIGNSANYNNAETECIKHEITTKTLTVVADDKTKEYGAANPNLTYTYSGNVEGETPSFTGSIATNATVNSNVSDYTINQGTLALTNGTGFTASNYKLFFINGKLTINKVSSPITIDESQNINVSYATTAKDYPISEANANGSGNITYSIQSQNSGQTPIEYFSVPTANVASIRVAANTPIGTYTVVVRATDSGNNNYNGGYDDMTLTVTVVASNPATCPSTLTSYTGTYNSEFHTITVSNDAAGGIVEYRTATTGEGSTWTTTKPTRNNAGTTTVYIRVKADASHVDADCGSRTITINKKEVTVTAADKSMNYGGTAPTYTSTTTGAVGSETAVSGTVSYTIKSGNTTVNNISTANAGTYDIVPSGLTAGSNYTINYVNGTLTINPVDATCPSSSSNYSETYDGESHTITATGEIGGTLKYRTATTGEGSTWSTTKPTRTNVGTTTVYVMVAGDSNHNDKDCGSKTITITAKTLTPTVTANDKEYDGTTTATCNSSVSLTGVVTGDTVTATANTTGSFANATIGENKQVTCTGITLDGEDKNNYTVATSGTTTADINKKTVTPAINSCSDKTYDGNNTANCTYSAITGKVGNETVSITGGTCTFDNKNVGTSKTVTCSGISLNGANASNYQLSTNSATKTANITAKEVTVTADDKSMNYGGTAPTYTYTVTGAIGSETAVSGTATYTIKSGNTTISNVSTASAGTYDIVPSGLTVGSNYIITYENGTLTIGSVAATCPSTFSNYSGTYDGSAHGVTATGHSGGTLKYRTATSGEGSTWTETAPTRTNVGTTTVYVMVAGDANHTDNTSCGSKTITISQREVSVTAPTVNSSTLNYSGSAQNLLATAGSCGNGGTMYYWSSNPSKTQTTAPTFATSNGWTTTAPTSTSYKGTDVGTYYIWYYCYVSDTTNNKAATGSSINTALSVTKEINKVSATCPSTFSNYSGTYDGSAHGITATGHSGGTLKYRTATSGEGSTWTETAPTRTNVGTTTVYVMVAGDANHTDNTSCGSKTITISQREVSVTAPTVNSSTLNYSGSAQNLLATAGSCGNGGTMYYWSSNPSKTQTTAPTFATSNGWTTTAPTSTSYKGTDVGTYYIWYYCYVSDTTNNKAATGSSINTALSVTKEINKVSATCPSTFSNYSGTYDGSAHGVTATGHSGGTLKYRTATSGEGSTWTETAPTRTNVGTTTVYVMVAGDANHTDNTSCGSKTITINKKSLTVTADDKSMNYGGSAPTYTYTATGFVTGETSSVLNGTASYTIKSGNTTITVGSTTPVGTYTIVPSGLSATNYEITYENGTLTIATRSVTASVGTCTNKEYDGTTTVTCTISLTGVDNGDSVNANGTCNVAASGTGSNKKVTCTGITLSGTDADKYVLSNQTAEKDNAVSITQKTLTASVGTCTDRAYNGQTGVTCTITLTGKVENEVVNGSGTCNAASSSAGSNKKVTCSSITLSGTDASKYTLSSTSAEKNSAVNINKATLTVTAADKTRSYGAANPTFTYTTSGAAGSETPAFTGSLTTTATPSSNVGSYDITQGTLDLTDGTGFDADNYTISYVKGTLTIEKADCTLTVTPQTIYAGETLILSSAASNSKGSLGFSLKQNGRNTTTPYEIVSGDLGGGSLSTSNDDDEYVDVIATDAGNSNYQGCSKDIVVTVQKKNNTMTANNGTVYVSSTTALSTFVQNNIGGSLSATKGTDNEGGTTKGSVSGTNFVAGTLAANDDTNKTVSLSIKAARTSTVKEKTVTVTVTVQKYTRGLTLTVNPTTVPYGTTAALSTTNSGTGGTPSTSVTYASSNTNVFTVSGSTLTPVAASGTSSITATRAGSETVKAATSSGVTATASKGTCNPPSGVTIGTDKKVSWTASSNATSYQVCVATGTNTCTPSTTLTSGSVYNAITDATGTRKVYVRSVCNSTNYNTPSTTVNGSTTVYSVSLTAGDGIDSVSGGGNYVDGATATITATVSTGYSFTNWTGTSTINTNPASVTVNGNKSYTANASGNTYTATFYYKGTSGVTSTTQSCTISSGSSCQADIPSAVKSSTGTYSNAYNGLSTSTGNMTAAVNSSATKVTLTGDAEYYALYSRAVTIYYPSNTTTATNKTVYRNQWLSSKTALADTVLATSATGTSTDVTAATISGYDTFVGFSMTASTNTAYFESIDALKTSDATTVYQINKKLESENATFYYSNSATGGKTSTTASGTKTTYLRCTSNSAAGTDVTHGGCTVPTTLTGEVSPYGTTSVGWATSNDTMTASESPTCTAGNSYYKVYSSDSTVAIYRPTSTTGSSAVSAYRNAFYGTGTNYSVILGRFDTDTTSISTPTVAAGYTIYGYAIEKGTITKTYDTIAEIAASDKMKVYTITFKNITPTFYYSNSANGTQTSITGTEAAQYLILSNTSSVEIVDTDYTIPSLTGEVAPTGTESVGLTNSASSMNTSTPNTSSTSWYKVYRSTVTVYKPDTTSTCDSTSTKFYRNAFYGTGSSYTKVLSSTNTGTTDNASYTSGVTGYSLAGFASSTGSNTIAYADLTAIKNSSATEAYGVLSKSVTATFKYSSAAAGTVSSTTASGTQYIRCKTTSVAEISNSTINPTITETEPTGSSAVGWATSANTLSTTSPTTAKTTYYRVYSRSITVYYPTSKTTATSASDKIYRNAYMTASDSATFTTVLASSATSKTQLTNSDITSTLLPNMYGTFEGLANNRNSYVVYDVNSSSAINNTRGVHYVVNTATESVTVTFYYSNSNVGAKTNSQVSGSRTNRVYCATTSTATTTTKSEGSISAPSTTAPYGTSLIGWATANNTMTTGDVTTANTAYYAVYRYNVTNYYYNGSSYTSRTLYRNGVYGTGTNYSMYLSTTNDGLSNYSTETGPGSSAWAGLSVPPADTTAEYETVAAAAKSSSTILYTVYQFNVNYNKGSNVDSIGSTTGNCKVNAMGGSTGGTSCNVELPSITPNSGYVSVGWDITSGATSGASAGEYTINNNPTTLYANAIGGSITFTSQTLSTGTYGTAYTSTAFTAATGGTGSYTYTIKSGAPSGATIDSANRTISFTNTTDAGTYNVVVTATDNNSNVSSDATMTIVINKINATNSVAISGTNTWGSTLTATITTNSDGAKSYKWYYSSTAGATSGGTAINATNCNTGNTCVIPSSVVGKYIYVVASVGNSDYYTTPSDATDATDSSTNTTQAVDKQSVTCTTSKGNYEYGGTIGNPSVSSNPGNATVTYYRNTTNSTSNGTAWSGTTSTTLSPNTYYIYATIPATTLYKGATCTTGSFTVSKGTCNPPSNVTIGTDKKVSWTASSNATSYQVCVASGTNTCTPSTTLTSGSVYNAITDATGTRKVYVRSVCNSTNYNTPSDSVSGTTTVYSVALTAGNGISAVTGTGNYITGATVTLDATVSDGYTWNKWTYTSGEADVSTTKNYSATISGNWAYTANATGNTYNARFYYKQDSYGVTDSLLHCTVSSGSSCQVDIPIGVTSATGYYGLSTSYRNMNIAVDATATKVTLTGNATYYGLYSSEVTIYYPSNTTTATSKKVYRNQWFINDDYGLSDPVLSTTRTGGTTNVTAETVSGYSTLVGFATSASTNTANYASIDALRNSSATTVYQINKKEESATATFYYSTAADGTIGSTTASGTRTTYIRPTGTTTAGISVSEGSCTVPSSLSGEVAPTGTQSIGWATNASSMSASASPGCATGNSYYKAYRNTVTIYKPTSTSACDSTSTVFYRNAFYGTGTKYTTVLSSSNTGTSDNASYSSGVSGYSLVGFASSTSSNTIAYADLTALKNSSTTTAYAVLGKSVTATFYYNQNTTPTCNTTSIKSTTSSGTQDLWCKSTASAELHNNSIDVPSAVSSSKGPLNTSYVNVASGTSSMTAATVNTGTTTYYAFYRANVTVTTPTSTTAATRTTYYRNQYFTSTSAIGTVLASNNTGTSNATINAGISGYSIVGYSASANTATSSYASVSAMASDTSCKTDYYQILSKDDTENATFYYSSSATGSKANTTASGTKTTKVYPTSASAATSSVTHGSCTAPSSLSGEIAPYGTTSIGWATANNTMTASETPTCTSGNSYYKVYRTSNISIKYPTSSTSATISRYRNAYYGNATNYTVVLSTQNGTSNESDPTIASGYTLSGYATTGGTNTKEYDTIAEVAPTTATTVYAIGVKSVTPTFYYSKDASGTIGSVTGTAENQYIRIKSTSSGTEISNTNFTIPTLTGEVAPYGTTSVSWNNSINHLGLMTPSTNDNKWYKFYRTQNVRIIDPSTTSECDNIAYSRNSFIDDENLVVGTSKYKTVLGVNNASVTDFDFEIKVSGYNLLGFANDRSTNTITYANIEAYKYSTGIIAYAVLSKSESENATFYYSNNVDGTKTSKTASGNKTTYLVCTVNDAAETNVNYGSCTVPSLTGEVAPIGTTSIGWATSASSMSTSTSPGCTTGNSYYKVYRGNVTNYYYNSNSYTSRTLYRNSVFVSGSTYTTYLSTSNTGLDYYTTATGPGSSAWAGLSTAADTTAEYTTVADAAASSSTSLYTIYQFNVTYTKGSNVGSIGSNSGSCKVSATGASAGGTSCNVTLPTITPNTGYLSVGWSATNGALTGTQAGASYSINSNPTTLYANAIPAELTFNDQTLNSGTYGSTYTSNAFTAVTGGSGDYTYTIASGAPSGATIDSTNRTISITNTTDAGTYNIVVTAIDNVTTLTENATMTIVIDPKPLMASTPSGCGKTYDGTVTAPCTTGVSGVVSGDTVTASATCTFADKNVGTGKTVTCSSYTISGSDAANYTAPSGSNTTTANITKKTLTSPVPSCSNKTYNGNTNAICSIGVTGIENGDSVTVSGSNCTFADKNVGTNKTVTCSSYSLTGEDSENYTAPSGTTTDTANITQKTLTATTASCNNRTYNGDTNVTCSVNVTGIAEDDDAYVIPECTFADKNAGTNKTVTCSDYILEGEDADNYIAPSGNITSTATINQKTLTATTPKDCEKTYDGNTTAPCTTQASGKLSGDALSVHATCTFANKNVGTEKTVTCTSYYLTGSDAVNYTTPSGSTTTTADITGIPLLASTPTSCGKTYNGNTTAPCTTGITGVLSGETVTASATCTYADKNVGTSKTVTCSSYTISGSDAGNYIVPTGSKTTTATITAKALTASTPTSCGKTYNGNTTAPCTTGVSGIVSGDTVTVSATCTYADKNVGSNKTVTCSSYTLSGTDAANYTAPSGSKTTTANITKKTLTATTPTNCGKTYNGNTTAPCTTQASGKISGDSLSVSATCTFADKKVGTSKTVTCSSYTLSGDDAGNYTAPSGSTTTTAAITAKALTANTPSCSNKVYNGNANASCTITFSGVVSGDTVTPGKTCTFNNATVGTGKTVTCTSFTISGTDASNYTAPTGSKTTTANITQANNPINYATNTRSWTAVYNASTARTATVPAPSSAQGTVTYAINSQKKGSTNVSVFSISGTTLTLAAGSATGVYTVVVRATAAGNTNYKSGYADLTYTVTVVNQKTMACTPSSGTSCTVVFENLSPTVGTLFSYFATTDDITVTCTKNSTTKVTCTASGLSSAKATNRAQCKIANASYITSMSNNGDVIIYYYGESTTYPCYKKVGQSANLGSYGTAVTACGLHRESWATTHCADSSACNPSQASNYCKAGQTSCGGVTPCISGGADTVNTSGSTQYVCDCYGRANTQNVTTTNVNIRYY